MTEKSRKALVQNLRDSGCSGKFVENFLVCYDRGETGEQMKLLHTWRESLLEQIHIEEKKISCLDYLIYQIQKAEA